MDDDYIDQLMSRPMNELDGYELRLRLRLERTFDLEGWSMPRIISAPKESTKALAIRCIATSQMDT